MFLKKTDPEVLPIAWLFYQFHYLFELFHHSL